MKKKLNRTSVRQRVAAGVLALAALTPGVVAVGGATAAVTAASVVTAQPAEAYNVISGTRYTWDGRSTCYRMEYRAYAWWEDPFGNRSGWFPVYPVGDWNCGRYRS